MRNVIGHRQTEKALQLGMMFSCNDALQVGLVDEVVSESETLDAAKNQLASWIKVPREFDTVIDLINFDDGKSQFPTQHLFVRKAKQNMNSVNSLSFFSFLSFRGGIS